LVEIADFAGDLDLDGGRIKARYAPHAAAPLKYRARKRRRARPVRADHPHSGNDSSAIHKGFAHTRWAASSYETASDPRGPAADASSPRRPGPRLQLPKQNIRNCKQARSAGRIGVSKVGNLSLWRLRNIAACCQGPLVAILW